MAKKTNTHTSPEIQNELLKLFSCEVAMYILCQITSNLQYSVFLNVMETMDVSNHEQVVICVRWVSANLDVHEDYIGLSHAS